MVTDEAATLLEALFYLQLLTVDARASSSCPGRITSLNHKVLFNKFSMSHPPGSGRRTDRDYAMEYNAVVVSSLRKLCKIFASLQLTDQGQLLLRLVRVKSRSTYSRGVIPV